MFRRYFQSPKQFSSAAFYAPLFRGVSSTSSSSSVFPLDSTFVCFTTSSQSMLLNVPLISESQQYFCVAPTPLLRCATTSKSAESVTEIDKLKENINTLETELKNAKENLSGKNLSEGERIATLNVIAATQAEITSLRNQQQQQSVPTPTSSTTSSYENTLTKQFLNEKNFDGLEINNLDYDDSCLSYLLYKKSSYKNPVAHRIIPKNTKEDPINIFIEGIKSLSDLLGKKPDKKKYFNLAVSGTSGQGKTQFLKYLQFFFDSVRPVDSVSNNIFSSTPSSSSSTEFCAEKKQMLENFYQTVNKNNNNNKSVVLFATFNQGKCSNFTLEKDTSAAILARTVLRMFNEYFSINFKHVASDVEFDDFVNFVRQFVAAKEKITDQGNIDKIPVILCVDELRKISIGETRVELLDNLASFQQEQLRKGSPTFIIVSSLDLWPVENVWKTKSQRGMKPIPLPQLPVDKLKEFMFKQMKGDTRSLWEEFVAASLDSCSGHARELEYVVEALLELKGIDDAAEWKLPKPQTSRLSNVIETSWHVGLKQIIVGGDGARVSYGNASDLENIAVDFSQCSEKERADIVASRGCLLKLLDAGFYLTKPDDTFGVLVLKPIARYISEFRFSVHKNDFFIRLWLKRLWEATRVLRDELVYKQFEIAMISALFLHARARFDVCSRDSRFDKLLEYQESDTTTIASPRGPSLGQVLDVSSSSKTEFYNENVKKFILPVGKCLSLKKVEEELWSDEADDTFCRYSTKPNQPAIEGTIELEDQEGERVIGYVQMKFLQQGTLQPQVVAGVIEKIIIFHNRSRNSSKKFCILLFGSGDSEELSMSNIKKNLKQGCFREDDILEKLNFVLIGAETCTKLLEPFGSSVLIKKLERRSAKKKKDEKERK